MKKQLRTFIWLLVAVLALAFLIYKTPRESFKEAISGINGYWAIAAIVLQLIAQTVLATRWVLLLRVNGVAIKMLAAIRLTYLGLFYNNVMPGGVGGDLLKGWYVTRHSEKHQRVAAAVSVFVDRVVGLIGTIMMGAVASLFVGGEIAYRGIQIRWVPWVLFTAMVVMLLIFLSRHLRRALMLSQLLKKLPFAQKLQQVDKAFRIYRGHVRAMLLALLLTVGLQGLTIVAIWLLIQALHFEMVSFVHCLIIMPIVWLIGAIPIAPGGVGIIEGCVTFLFCLVINPDDPGQAMGKAAALALMNRVVILYICSVPGVLVPLFGGHLPKASDMEKEMQAQEQVEE